MCRPKRKPPNKTTNDNNTNKQRERERETKKLKVLKNNVELVKKNAAKQRIFIHVHKWKKKQENKKEGNNQNWVLKNYSQ